MDTKFFYDPFATGGDRSAVPDGTQPDGSVSYQQGYGPDYSLDPESDPDSLLLVRPQFNEILYQVTAALGALQKDFPQWVSASDNGGSPLAYNAEAVVRYSDGHAWQSLVDANTATPGTDVTKWIRFLSNYATAAALTAEVVRAMTAEALLAPLASPDFTGSPRAPTASPGTGGNLLATCAYVLGAVQSETNRAVAVEETLAPIDSPNFVGTPAAGGLPLATRAYADAGVAAERSRAMGVEATLAPIDSPALVGVPTVPTPPADSSDSTVPNTSWVQAWVASLFNAIPSPTAFPSPGFNPAVPGSFQWGGFILKWAIGPYDPANNSEPFRNLAWDTAFPTACFVAFVSTDLAFGGNTMDSWYQTAGWDTNGVNVQRQRPPQGAWTIPTRAVAIGIGW